MSPDVQVAYEEIQKRLLRATTPQLVERYELSLNEFLRQPGRSGDARRLINNAYGNAGKVVRQRLRRITAFDPAHHDFRDESAEAEFQQPLFGCFLDQTCPSQRDRMIGKMLLRGDEAAEVAATLSVTEANAHVLISRLRKRNRISWEKEVV
jgi:hypothetical protein